MALLFQCRVMLLEVFEYQRSPMQWFCNLHLWISFAANLLVACLLVFKFSFNWFMYLLSIFKNLLSDSALIAVQCAQWGKIYDPVQTCWCDQHSTKVYCCTNQTISIHTKPCWTLQSGQNLPFLRLQTCWRQSTQYASSIRLKSYQTKL